MKSIQACRNAVLAVLQLGALRNDYETVENRTKIK